MLVLPPEAARARYHRGMSTAVIVFGAGPIGIGVARELATRASLRLLAVVDTDPGKQGSSGAVEVVQRPPDVAAAVAVLTTTSSLRKLAPLALDCIARGWHVVSTCEELAWPFGGALDDVASSLDNAARAAGVCVLGTGVNPGFVMDALPLALTAPCRAVTQVRVERVQDAAPRRRPFQDKVGVGMQPDDVTRGLRQRSMGHVGLENSARMVAHRLGLVVTAFHEVGTVVVAQHEVTCGQRTVHSGEVLGVEQTGTARHEGGVAVELYFRATFGQIGAHDRVLVSGEPSIDVTVAGGIPGDTATCAMVVNSIPTLLWARPGLRTMADIGLVAYHP